MHELGSASARESSCVLVTSNIMYSTSSPRVVHLSHLACQTFDAYSLTCYDQVWYGVPANASTALEEAMKDALPDLFEAAPDLMYSLVTMVSPMNLQVCSCWPQKLLHDPSMTGRC